MAIRDLQGLAKAADFSLIDTLVADPQATSDGVDHAPRPIPRGHYVPVKPEPIENPQYVIHSKTLFEELSLSDDLAIDEAFTRLFSGDLSQTPEGLRSQGWACGYALSIYGNEYTEQCPFRTGNGYGDGRAISVYEGVIQGKRWEMQLKGGGRTPYCRGADGRAVLRSSIREFLAQEHMHALGIPTSRSLSLYTSKTEVVHRPWFNDGSRSVDPEVMIEEPVAISTRVAPSFLRVGQVELFGRRARKGEHPDAMDELREIVLHLMEREYPEIHASEAPFVQKCLLLATSYGERLTDLVRDWIRVGYCQGNFNSDNCAAGGFTLDYGPFGMMEAFDPKYQPWTGGGLHFSFLNQPQAAEQNLKMLCIALKPLLESDEEALQALNQSLENFPKIMEEKLYGMWASKLGLKTLEPSIFNELAQLMMETTVDYTIFFRELSKVPESIDALKISFYGEIDDQPELKGRWEKWLAHWLSQVQETNPEDINATTPESRQKLSAMMKQVNPKFVLREWFLVAAYRQAHGGDHSLIHELNEVMTAPYAEQSQEVEERYYRKKPKEYFDIAGISHVSCSS